VNINDVYMQIIHGGMWPEQKRCAIRYSRLECHAADSEGYAVVASKCRPEKWRERAGLWRWVKETKN